jgi:FdhD protein
MNNSAHYPYPSENWPTSSRVVALPVQFSCERKTSQFNDVAVEVPVNIVYGTIPYAVMMATPAELEDFAAGFSLTEGIIRKLDDIKKVVLQANKDGVVVNVTLKPDPFRIHLARRRNLSGRTSCGVCGVDSIADLPYAETNLGTKPAVSLEAIRASVLAIEHRQPLNALTRSVHAAAWCDSKGCIVATREDVGRHNALDKLIGAGLRAGYDPMDGFILVTSRASFEMVEKAAIFGAGTLISISAPTSHAISRANKHGLTLVSIARRDGAVVFTGQLAS